MFAIRGSPRAARGPEERARQLGMRLAAAVAGVALSGCTAAVQPDPRTAHSSPPSTTVAPLVFSTPEPAPSHPGEIDPAFKARADTACQPYSDYNQKHPFPYPSFDPRAPDVALLSPIGTFFDANPANHSLFATLTGIGTPRTGTVAWHTWLALAQQNQEIGLAQIAAAKKSDGPAFVATVRQIERIREPTNQALLAAGFTSTDPCYNA